MSLFGSNRQSFFDFKKKLGTVDQQQQQQQRQQQSARVDNEGDSVQDGVHQQPMRVDSRGDSSVQGWVELAPSRASLCSSIDQLVLIDQEGNGVNNKDSRLSPVSLQSPHVELENLEQVKYRLVKDMLPPGRNTDWIWDWSSRPEAVPPKAVRYRSGASGANNGSNMTTPPNSPAPETTSAFNLRHSPAVRSVFFRVEVLVSLVLSNFISVVLGAAIGYCICKKLSRSSHEDF